VQEAITLNLHNPITTSVHKPCSWERQNINVLRFWLGRLIKVLYDWHERGNFPTLRILWLIFLPKYSKIRIQKFINALEK